MSQVYNPLKGLEQEILEERKKGVSVVILAQTHQVSRQAIYLVLKKMERDGHEVPWNRTEKRKKPCHVCGKEFFPSTNKVKTCSPPCQKSYRREKMLDKDSPWSRLKFENLVCFHCGVKFTRVRQQQMIALKRFPEKKDFCSRKCNIKNRYA